MKADDANAILQREGADVLRGTFDRAVTKQPREDLLLAAWLTRELPLRDYLLGNVFCTTSRWLIFGDTGVGKSLLALSIAGAMASKSRFLCWDEGRRRARVMYLDGETPAETFKDRMQLVADEFGSDLVIFGYNRDVLGPNEMPPLNTPEGERWLWREIETVKPDAIIFDSVMSLLVGSMAEEESWAPVKLLMRKITSARIGQIWLHHTGHDASKSFGTKTREWEMDTVVRLAAQDDQSILVEFMKARLRTPKTAEQFKKIARGPDGWTIVGDGAAAKLAENKSEIENLKIEILRAYHRLADGRSTSAGLAGEPVRKMSVDELRDELKRCGLLDKKDTGGITGRARNQFSRAKASLLSENKPRLFERDGLVWA